MRKNQNPPEQTDASGRFALGDADSGTIEKARLVASHVLKSKINPPVRLYGRDLRIRQQQPEWMDDPQLDAGLHQDALSGLRRIHWFSGTVGALWGAISGVAGVGCGGRGVSGSRSSRGSQGNRGNRGNSAVRILDLASGGGDLAIAIAERCRSRGISAVVHGCDISGTAVSRARELASLRGVAGVDFFQLDVLQDPWPEDRYDVVMNSLFLHHLSAESIVGLLGRMRAGADCVVVDDLLRTTAGYWLAWAGCRLLSRSPVVHFDGPVSVEAALTLAEARELSEEAGLTGAELVRHWPERFLLTWQSGMRSVAGGAS